MSLSDETIYTKHKDDLIRYATALVGPADAEDVLSTVVLRVLERRSLSDLDDARAYLFRAVLNEAHGRARRKKPVLPRDEPSWIPERDHEVVAALRRLPPRQRAAVYLVYWEDRSIEETARTMGASPGTVKRYLHLARRRLKGTLT
ncbi:MAG: sigma-70 family RNA polymerase sigma factor [Acidimicrobiia bacterium]